MSLFQAGLGQRYSLFLPRFITSDYGHFHCCDNTCVIIIISHFSVSKKFQIRKLSRGEVEDFSISAVGQYCHVWYFDSYGRKC